MTRYLSKEETEKFNLFLINKKIKRAKVARILGVSGGSITNYFKNNKWKISDFEMVRRVLKDEALEGFEGIEF